MRDRTIGRIADDLVERPIEHPLRVAIDGVTAAGKTTFAADLTAAITARGRTARHLSTDDYHQVAAVRHRDPDRARGYYADAYDLATFRRLVLDPLGPGGDRRYRARWDVVIWLDIAFDVALERAIPRDAAQFGSAAAVREAYETRYHPACRLYLADVDPRANATIVLDDADLAR